MAGKKGMRAHLVNLGTHSIDKIRSKIKTGVILDRVQKHILGEIEMSPTQMTAAQTLLRKVIPDLSAVEHSGSVDTFTTFLQSLPAQQPTQISPGSTQEVTKLPDPIQQTETLQ
jgi:hypothetical protein